MLTFIGDLQVPLRGHLHVGYRGCDTKNVAPRQLRSWDGTYQTFYFEEVVVLATDQSVRKYTLHILLSVIYVLFLSNCDF
jgi:hypothetical protein